MGGWVEVGGWMGGTDKNLDIFRGNLFYFHHSPGLPYSNKRRMGGPKTLTVYFR